MREEKKRTAVTPRPNRIEEQMIRFDKGENPTIADWNLKGFYPRVAWPARGSGAAVGLRYWQPDFWGPLDMGGAAFYSLRSYQHYDLQFGLLPHVERKIPSRSWKGDDVYELASLEPGSSRIPLYVTLRHRYLPQNDFYGLGPDSSLDERTNFLHEEKRLYFRTGYRFSDHVVWIVNGGWQWNRIDSGKSSRLPSTEEVFDDESAPGLSSPPDYFRAGTQFLIDYRDQPANPHHGFMAALAYQRFDDRESDAYSFDRVGADLRGFIPLGSPQRVLALRSRIHVDNTNAANEVPFFMQESLGGSHNLRGFDSFRWRGERVLLYQAEYRWEPLPLWELSVFADAGKVAARGGDIGLSALQTDWGFGTRFKTYRDVVLRMEIAFGRETTRYYIRGSASF